MPDLSTVAQALQDFGGDPRRAGHLAATLGFTPVSTPADLLGGAPTPLRRFFEARTDRFGIGQLYRAGSIITEAGVAGMYVAVLNNWGVRSTDRDRARRRVARALVELTTDARAIFLMVPHAAAAPRDRRYAEFVFPRSRVDVRQGASAGGALTTVRALIDLEEPTRFHRELLRDLAVQPGSSLLAISQKWQQAFSVERVTKRFYQQYARVRDELARVLNRSNPDHPVIRELSERDARAWATRQLGRILFLWFLQAKRWLGYEQAGGEGSETYLLDLWHRRSEAPNGFYQGMLLPLFFEAMAQRHPRREVRELLGYTPYLNGGLFRRNALEDRIEAGGPVRIPDEAFDPDSETTALGLLRSYRFTTRESTPDDQSVDPDPELLGRVFENLYQGDERHDTGTYYTPREIVHFMCRQALDGYLRDTAGVDQETIDWLRRLVTEPDGEERRLDEETEHNLTSALENVRICDPAVGSGAFLLGAMQEIVQLRRGLLHARREYVEDEQQQVAAWKRRAIQWSLYGVDINPEAVEICQLRLWLSLVLDMWDPRTVEPLPNLDFRIVAADSLVDRVGDIVFAESLGGIRRPPMKPAAVEREERNIAQWRREFEATQDNPARLRELRDNINRAYHRIVRMQIEDALTQAREEARTAEARAGNFGRARLHRAAEKARARVKQLEEALASTDADAPYQKPFLWPVAFKEVFDDGGFDIVLANPPYVRQEKLSPADQEVYAASFPEVHAGTADILVYFYARAVQILRQGGWLSFITSNSFVKRQYGQALQAHLARSLEVQSIIDFGEAAIFEATVEPYVLVAKKTQPEGEHRLLAHNLYPALARRLGRSANVERVREELTNLDGLLVEDAARLPQVMLSSSGWRTEDEAVLRLFERLMSQGTPLGEYVQGRMYRGVLTGLNEAFVIDQAKRDELVAADPRSAEVIKPWLRGRDIKRWKPQWAGLYVIFTRRGIEIDRYPTIKAHLEQFRQPRYDDRGQLVTKGLEPRGGAHYRKPGDYAWYEIQDSVAYYQEFERPKVVWPDISRTLRFAWDESGAFVGNTGYILPDQSLWLLGYLNSAVAEFALRLIAMAIRGGFLRAIDSTVRPLPVFVPSVREQQAWDKVVGRCIAGESTLQAHLDELAAHAAGLSPGELNAIYSWFESRSLPAGTEDEAGEAVDQEDGDD